MGWNSFDDSAPGCWFGKACICSHGYLVLPQLSHSGSSTATTVHHAWPIYVWSPSLTNILPGLYHLCHRTERRRFQHIQMLLYTAFPRSDVREIARKASSVVRS